jgi:hypothetical protein
MQAVPGGIADRSNRDGDQPATTKTSFRLAGHNELKLIGTWMADFLREPPPAERASAFNRDRTNNAFSPDSCPTPAIHHSPEEGSRRSRFARPLDTLL